MNWGLQRSASFTSLRAFNTEILDVDLPFTSTFSEGGVGETLFVRVSEMGCIEEYLCLDSEVDQLYLPTP